MPYVYILTTYCHYAYNDTSQISMAYHNIMMSFSSCHNAVIVALIIYLNFIYEHYYSMQYPDT